MRTLSGTLEAAQQAASGTPAITINSKLHEYYHQEMAGGLGSANYTGNRWIGQTFTVQAGDGHTVTRVLVQLMMQQTFSGNIELVIRATSGGLPTGADLCSGSIDGSKLSTSVFRWESFDLGAGRALSASTMYAIIVRAPSGSWPGAGFRAQYNGTLTGRYGYVNGRLVWSIDSGVNWTLGDVAKDLFFEEWE